MRPLARLPLIVLVALALLWPGAGALAASQTVADIQRDLSALGYDAGTPDGVYGPRTGDAIRRYQADHRLLVDGVPSEALRDHVSATLAGRAAPAAAPAPSAMRAAPAPERRVDAARIREATELRDGPRDDASVLATLPAGADVDLRGYAGAWAEVRTRTGQEGWVRAPAVELASSSDGGGSSAGTGWLRSLTGFLAPRGSRSSQSQATASIGVRGLTPDELRAASPAPMRVEAMEQFAVALGDAEARAVALGLSSREVAYLDTPAAAEKSVSPVRPTGTDR